MKKIILLSAFIAYCLTSFAQAGLQDAYKFLDERVVMDTVFRKFENTFALNLNQAAFSENWKGGGVNSLSLGTLLNSRLQVQKHRLTSLTQLQLQYGFQENKDSEHRKTQDQIFFDNKLGYRIAPKLDLFVSLNFQSQFDNGYDYKKDSLDREYKVLISRFMSPGYLTEAMGLRYIPSTYFSVSFAPIAFRQTFVLDKTLINTVPANYGVDSGKTVLNQFGYQLMADFSKELVKNISLKVRYYSFGEYDNFAFKRTVHRLDAALTAKVTRYINTNLTLISLYDINQDKNIQFSQALALGVVFNFTANK